MFFIRNKTEMKYIFLTLALAAILISSCGENSTTEAPKGEKTFVFKDLAAQDTMILINSYTFIKAMVEPADADVTYRWGSTEGAVVGSGQSVRFTICHKTTTEIFCTITDKNNNTETKKVYVSSFEIK
jgi:hypothetical protein